VWVIASGMLDFSNERGAELVKQLWKRLGAALEDHRFTAYLDTLI